MFPRRFSDRYVLLKELGRGGMGHVFLGVTGDAGAQRVCALKIVRDLSRDRDPAELSARFLDEAKVVTKLTHDNLVYVFDFGVVSGQGYLAMEFVEGKTLTEVWNRCAMRAVGFPIGLSLFAASELCSGLSYAHRAGDLNLVHRDVSPSNVMLSFHGGIKLIDFGLAKWRSKVAETQAGVNWGKVSYMSPEQYLGRPIDHRSDLFSVGLILWELLTGRQLFPTPESRSTDFVIPPPSQFNQHISPELDATVLRALAESPADRFRSGEEMAAALLAHVPREAGKLALGEFVRSLFESDLRTEAAEREALVTGASALREPTPPSGPGQTSSSEDGARDPLLGTLLTERYFVRRLVGEGAMGRVYEGHHTGIGKRVAIKIPRFGERRRAELMQRFRLEAQAASQIRHPNIADVTDSGSTPDGRFFFVMEFIDGIDISQLVRREGALSIERALLIAIQVCRALEAAHKAGIIHRDLKPSNVMLLRDRDNEVGDLVKVLDFGVAKFLRSDVAADRPDLTLLDAAVGTPKYMAPEQIERGQEIDFRVDTYGVGGLLYFMLSGGHAPIEGDTVEDIWRRKVSDEVTPIANWRSDLPPTVESIVARCLMRDPAARPDSMEILRRDLLLATESLRAVGSAVLPRLASSTSIVDRGGGRHTARRTFMVLGLGGVAAGVIALGIDGRLNFRKSPDAAAVRSQAVLTAPRDVPVPAQRPVAGEVAVARAPSATPAPAEPVPVKVPGPTTAPASPGVGTTTPSKAAIAPSITKARSTAALTQASLSGRDRGGVGRVGSRTSAATGTLKLTTPSGGAANESGVPRTAQPAYAKAHTAWQEGRLAEAAMLTQKALNLGAGAEGHLLLGHIYRAMGDHDQAKTAYQRSMQIDPSNPRALAGLKKAEDALRAKVHGAATPTGGTPKP